MKHLSLLVAALVTVPSCFAQAPDLKAALAEIGQVRQAAADRVKNGEKLTRPDIEGLVAAKAKALASDLVPNDVDAKDADGWAQICETAGLFAKTELLAAKSVRYHAMVAFQAQATLLHAYLEQGKFTAFQDSLRYVMATDSTMIGQLGDSVGYYAAKYAKSNPQLLIDAYDALLSRIDLKHPPVSKIDRQFRDYAYVSISVKKLELIAQVGRRTEAVAKLKALRARFATSNSTNAFGQSPVVAIDELLGRWGMVSSAAPVVKFDRAIGDFRELSALKGKVVLLDFFAHWCGPCKAAFPEIREITSEYKERGLVVQGVTSYYGYIGAKQGIKPEAEYEAMKKFVDEQQMTWPVGFDPKQDSFKAFQVGAIPHMVLIDRQGKVRAFYVGYEPTRRPEIKSQIEKLLAER